MITTATITSKRQLTIPAPIYRLLNLKRGQKVIIFQEGEVIKIISSLELVNRLTGSVEVPDRFKKMPLDKLIEKAFRRRSIRSS